MTDSTAVLKRLRKLANRKTLDGLRRYGIPSDHALGVPVNQVQKLAKTVGPSHRLAQQLWKTGWYEARMLAVYLEEPDRVTAAQMDRWTRDFDNWAICDTACFVLFDRTPHGFDKAAKWADQEAQFVKRAGFALMACLALHRKEAPDAPFLNFLRLIEKGALDERNFVKKGVSWAIRLIGRRNAGLHGKAVDLARKLAASSSPAARWIGKDAARDLTAPAVTRKVAAPPRRSKSTRRGRP